MRINLSSAEVNRLNHFSDHKSLDSSVSGHFPDFLVVGPQRTGTTWVYENLKSLPEVFFSFPKELYYFSRVQETASKHSLHWDNFDLKNYLGNPKVLARELVKIAYFDFIRTPGNDASSLDWYTKFFSDDLMNRAIAGLTDRQNEGLEYDSLQLGEATASYAALEPSMIADITTINPDLRVVLMVRDPVERAWSHAKKDLLRDNLSEAEDQDFYEFFESEYQIRCGKYSENIANWSQALKPGNLYLGNYSQIKQAPERVAQEIAQHICEGEVNENLLPNVARPVNPTPKDNIPERYRRHLEYLFRDERKWFSDFLASTL